MIPLLAGKLTVLHAEPCFDQMRYRKVDIIPAQQDVLTHCDALDEGDRTPRILAHLKQAEVRSAAADIDHQHVPRPAIAIR